MSELFEIVFESVDARDIVGLADALCEKGSSDSSGRIRDFLVESDNNAIGVPGRTVRFGDIRFESGAFRILRYDGNYDLEVTVDLEVPGLELAKAVQSIFEASGDLARRFGVKEYFGGIEPASDEETRFFTKDVRGPLHPAPGSS